MSWNVTRDEQCDTNIEEKKIKYTIEYLRTIKLNIIIVQLFCLVIRSNISKFRNLNTTNNLEELTICFTSRNTYLCFQKFKIPFLYGCFDYIICSCFCLHNTRPHI